MAGTAQISGLVSGLDTASIISQLMSIERMPEQALTTQKTNDQNMVSLLQQLNSLVSSLQTSANAFVPDVATKQSNWTATTASTSDSTIATATTDSTAVPGSVTFSVTSQATAGAAVSAGTVASTTTAVANGAFLLSKGAAAVGFSDLSAGATLSAGQHTIAVTQASAGASLTGSSPLASSVTIDSTNNTLSVYLDGSSTATTYTLAAGTYTPAQLAAQVASASGGALTASVNSSGALQLGTTHEGSAATLQLAAANSALGLSDTTTVATGTDGILTVDGTTNTLTDLRAGNAVTLNGANGDTISATLGGGVRAGTATTTAVSVAAGGTLSDVVNAINSAGAGVTAAAVQTGTNAYKLQITSSSTGSNTDVTVSANAFNASLGALQQLSAGTDTVLHVGTGPGAYDVTSSSTSVTGLLPGVTVNVAKASPGTPVTLTIASDANGIAGKMKSLVDSMNSVISLVNSNNGYDSTSNTAGQLMGNSLTSSLVTQISTAVIGTSTSTPSMYGVSVQRDGTIAFDQDAFLAAYASNPAGAQAALTTMAQALNTTATQMSDPVSGLITSSIQSYQDDIKDVTDQISAFEDRMTLKQQQLQDQFDALEQAMSTSQSQSQWLTSQLSGLMKTYS